MHACRTNEHRDGRLYPEQPSRANLASNRPHARPINPYGEIDGGVDGIDLGKPSVNRFSRVMARVLIARVRDVADPETLAHLASAAHEWRFSWLRYVRTRLGGEADGEDVVHEAYRRALECEEVLLTPERANRYVFGILRNVVHERLRDKASAATLSLGRSLPYLYDGEPSPEHVALVREILESVEVMFGEGTLDVKAFGLWLQGHTIREVAELLGRPPSTIGWRTQRVRRELKDLLTETS